MEESSKHDVEALFNAQHRLIEYNLRPSVVFSFQAQARGDHSVQRWNDGNSLFYFD